MTSPNMFQGFTTSVPAAPTPNLFAPWSQSTFNPQTTQPAQSTQPSQSSMPSFGSVFPSPVFGAAQQPSSTQQSTTTQQSSNNQDKGQIIQCLSESKNVQLAILAELKTLNQKVSQSPQFGNQLQVTTPQFTTLTPKPSHNAFCNGCNKQGITGIRYKCLICADYDLCEECESKMFPVHDATHPFAKIKDQQQFNLIMEKKPQVFGASK